jgi:hypothetical protein
MTDFDTVLGLVAVAEHCGMPTTMFEFTSDVRVAASLATADGQLGQIGEIVVLDPQDFDAGVRCEVNPYGRLIFAAPNPGIEKRKAQFLQAAIPAVLKDPDTTLIERTYRFRQDDRPFPAVGGYLSGELLKDARELRQVVMRTAEDPAISDALKPQLERYSAGIEELSNTSDRASDEEYEHACVSFLGDLVSDEISSADRTVAAVFLLVQKELRDRGIRKYSISHARGMRRAMDEYLSAAGSLEARLMAGVEQGWLSRMDSEEHLLMEIVNRRVAEYFDVS